ncbi:hypothetical protein MCOR25_003879 [Pyricularia grisea]|nr:hypothetical protein MCOR25_003879 [Pyricularia grisea]
MPPPVPPVRSFPQPPTLGSVRQQGVRAPSRVRTAANNAANNSGQPDPSPAAKMVAAATTLASGLSPRPQKFSTNYGSEAFQPFTLDHSRNYAMQSTDLGSALARAAKKIQPDKPKEDSNADADAPGTANAAAPANSLLGKRKELDLAAGSRDPKRQKTTQDAGELAHDDQDSAASRPRGGRGTSASRQTSQGAAGSSRFPESGTDGSVSGLPTDDGSTVRRRTRRGSSKPSGNATVSTPSNRRISWDDLPLSRRDQRPHMTASERPETQTAHKDTAIEEGDDVDMIDLEEDFMDEQSVPQTPDRPNWTFLQVPDALSSVAPTEKSYNTESVIYRNTTLSTPQGHPSSPAPGSALLGAPPPNPPSGPPTGPPPGTAPLGTTLGSSSAPVPGAPVLDPPASDRPASDALDSGASPSGAHASGDATLNTNALTEQQTTASRGTGDSGDLAKPSPEPNPPSNPVSTAGVSAININADVDIINPLNPMPLPRRTPFSSRRAQTPESQTYHWNSSPEHRGIRSHSDSPNSKRYVATHLSHNLESNYRAPEMSEYEDGFERAARARQQHVRNRLLPPDVEEDSRLIRDIGATSARSDLTSAFLRAHTEAPETHIRPPAGARGLFIPNHTLGDSQRRGTLFEGSFLGRQQPRVLTTGDGPPSSPSSSSSGSRHTPNNGAPLGRHQSRDDSARRDGTQGQGESLPPNDTQGQGGGTPPDENHGHGGGASPSGTQSQSSKVQKLREWVQALSTGWTHLSRSIWSIIDTLSQWQVYLFQCIWNIFQALTKAPIDFVSSLWKHFTLRRFLVPLLFGVLAVSVALSYDRLASFEGISSNDGIRWHGWQDWKESLGQLVSPPFGHNLPGTNGNYSKIVAAFKSHDKDILEIKGKAMMQDAALAKLEQILPEFVRMSDDKVPHEFYVGVRDLMQQDPQIPTLDKDGNISEEHAKAIEKHIETFFWRWLRENARQIRQIAGIGQDSQLSDEELNRIVRQVAEEKPFEVVSKDEFLQILKKQLAKHHDETASQMENFQGKLAEFRRQLQQVMARSSGSMSQEQIQQNLDKALSMFAGKSLLESFAKGRIKATDEEVTSAVNHFSIRSGALIDVYRTSPAYKWPNKAHLGHKRFQTENKNGPIKSPIYAGSVLDPWEADGDCWCAGTGQSPNRRLKTTGETHKVPLMAADIAIMTKRVIPQVLRLEHISAKETVEPESMPNEVEVWIQLDEDHEMFDHAISWSMAYFPEVDRHDPLTADKFVKIGHFVYPNETEVGHSGENFYFPKDVYRFGFATTKFLIRAKNNYGSHDHTCFYQLILNGKLLPMDE